MDKIIFQLLKYLCKFVGFQSTKTAAKYLLQILQDAKFFNLSKHKQKIILSNLVTYFDTLILGIENIRGNKYMVLNKPNKHINKNDILYHIENKIKCLVNYEFSLY